MDWLSRLLVCVLVATGIFVAVVSSCQSLLHDAPSGGSCSETQIEPAMPLGIVTDAIVPLVPLLWFAAAVTTIVALVQKPNFHVAAAIRTRWRFGPSGTKPFFKDLFLPYLAATRDP